MSTDFDPKTCITAGQLRNFGVTVPENIPDCAWIPQDSIVFGRVSSVSIGDGRLSFEATVTFHSPFRWVEVTVQKSSFLKDGDSA